MAQFLPFPGYNPSGVQAEQDSLPCAGYVARIEHAIIEEGLNGKALCLTLDIVEGRYTGWFRKDYESRQSGRFTVKHRGRFKLFYPRCDGSERDGWTIDRFNRSMHAIHISNPGFEWDGTAEMLIGKYVGIVTREAEWNGHVYIEIGKLISITAVRTNNYHMMPRRVQKQIPPMPADPPTPFHDIPPGFTPVNPGNDLPF